MGFSSIFGKKEPDDKDKKSRAKPVPDAKQPASTGTAAPVRQTKPRDDAAHRELAKATARKIDQIESEMSLDFLPGKSSPPKAGTPKPVTTTPPASTAATAKPVVKPAAKPATKTAPIAKPKPAPGKPSNPPTLARPTEGPPTLPPLDMSSSIILGDTIGAMALEISSSDSAPIIEEVAILYANGQGISAANALASAVREDQLGNSTGQAWLMLFDLYQLLGKKPEFENLALDFVGRFESSPPDWENDDALAPAAAVETRAANNGGGAVFFAPILDETVVKSWEQIKKASERSNQIKVDFTNVKRVNGAGCAFLLKALPTLAKAGHTLIISGLEQFVSVLLSNIETGRRDPSDAPWLLLLEMYRVLDKQAEFEEKSIDYCITFEVSPPSWEGVPKHLRLSQETPVLAAQTVQQAAAPTEEFKLNGELLGKAEMDLSKLTAFATERNLISVNCKSLRRVDFAAGGTLLNMLVSLTSAGKRIEFNHVNHLVAALFIVMGIHELALINVKRA